LVIGFTNQLKAPAQVKKALLSQKKEGKDVCSPRAFFQPSPQPTDNKSFVASFQK
jgi:hypothetical protein